MTTIKLQDIKQKGSKALPKSGEGPGYVIVNSDILGVYLPIDEYEAMQEILEDWEDLQEGRLARNDAEISFEDLANKLKISDELLNGEISN